MRGGFYLYNHGSLDNQSNRGYYWLRRLNSATDGYRLNFYYGYVYPQYSNHRSNGFALRCLALAQFRFRS